MELLIHNARYEKEFNVQKVETSGDKWRDQVFSALVRKQFDNLERLIGDTAAANIFFLSNIFSDRKYLQKLFLKVGPIGKCAVEFSRKWTRVKTFFSTSFKKLSSYKIQWIPN